MADVPVCLCHGEPMYRSRKPGRRSDTWQCAVKKRDYERARYQTVASEKNQKAQQRYDDDPVYRISKRLHDDAHRRAVTLKRRREQVGALSLERFDGSAVEQHPSQDHKAA